jgi:hypothetical protein
MTRKTAAGWHTYKDVDELLTELDLTGEDMDRARDTTDDHIRAWHLARARLPVVASPHTSRSEYEAYRHDRQ